ncbi:MAG: hypothetical protein LBS60_06235, partial [Deltaproteobacteria bacterium]|nr:hypothetical protein [Deltaproteobacteria bacterium]
MKLSGLRPGKKKALLGALSLILVLTAGWFYYQAEKAKAERHQEELFQSALAAVRGEVRAEENFEPRSFGPPPTETTPETDKLWRGATAFSKKRFHEAINLWDDLLKTRAGVKDLEALAAAAHLREKNYSLAAQKYRAILAKKEPGANPQLAQVKAAQDELGLSLALFHLRDYPLALKAAENAYNFRLKRFGPFHRETLSSANILASSLMGLQDNAKALELLKTVTDG